MRVSSEPAENTSTSPLGLALAELEELGELVALGVVLLLQPAMASPTQAIDANAPISAPRF
jgi:hypothetical protein